MFSYHILMACMEKGWGAWRTFQAGFCLGLRFPLAFSFVVDGLPSRADCDFFNILFFWWELERSKSFSTMPTWIVLSKIWPSCSFASSRVRHFKGRTPDFDKKMLLFFVLLALSREFIFQKKKKNKEVFWGWPAGGGPGRGWARAMIYFFFRKK